MMTNRLFTCNGAERRRDVDDRNKSGHDARIGLGWALTLALMLGAAALGGCRLVATQPQAAPGAGEFDPIAKVQGIWDPQVIPYLEAKAGPLHDVLALAGQSPDQAGAKYGHKPKEGNEPWTYVTRISGRIVAAETSSRAATISVDTDGDGRIAAVVQIGPAIRGTAIRDALDFVSFNDFKNQIDYAQFGKAFNQYATRAFLSKLPRDALVGRKVTVLGAFTLDSPDQPPLVSPTELTLGPPP